MTGGDAGLTGADGGGGEAQMANKGPPRSKTPGETPQGSGGNSRDNQDKLDEEARQRAKRDEEARQQAKRDEEARQQAKRDEEARQQAKQKQEDEEAKKNKNKKGMPFGPDDDGSGGTADPNSPWYFGPPALGHGPWSHPTGEDEEAGSPGAAVIAGLRLGHDPWIIPQSERRSPGEDETAVPDLGLGPWVHPLPPDSGGGTTGPPSFPGVGPGGPPRVEQFMGTDFASGSSIVGDLEPDSPVDSES